MRAPRCPLHRHTRRVVCPSMPAPVSQGVARGQLPKCLSHCTTTKLIAVVLGARRFRSVLPARLGLQCVRQRLLHLLHTPLLSFLTTSAARSARRAAGLLHPAADHGVHMVSVSPDQASFVLERSNSSTLDAFSCATFPTCRIALQSFPPVRSHPLTNWTLIQSVRVDA